MHDPALMRDVQRRRNLSCDRDRFMDRSRPTRDPLFERLPLDQFEHERAYAFALLQPVDPADVRVAQRGEDFGLPLEPGEALGVGGKRRRENLERDVAFEASVAGAVDLAHSTRAKGTRDLVGTDSCTRRKHR